MKILLTGGAGYIGSHIAVELLDSGYDVMIADNYSNSSPEAVRNIERITGRKAEAFELDMTDAAGVDRLFAGNRPDAVIHLAGFKAVGESVTEPLMYYRNNLGCAVTLLEAMEKHKVERLIFSSSATVYGPVNAPPYTEDMETGKCSNPYGTTKLMIEQIIADAVSAGSISAVILRYFNPVGAHKSGLIGEEPRGTPNNLMPYITQVASGRLPELSVYGTDYPTRDGTCLRDYIHVTDLAKGHVRALEYYAGIGADGADGSGNGGGSRNGGGGEGSVDGVDGSGNCGGANGADGSGNGGGVAIFNLGTGNGVSVLEMISAFETANGVRIPRREAPRRQGDLPVTFADVSKAAKLLGWRASLTIEDMCRDAYRFAAK